MKIVYGSIQTNVEMKEVVSGNKKLFKIGMPKVFQPVLESRGALIKVRNEVRRAVAKTGVLIQKINFDKKGQSFYIIALTAKQAERARPGK